MPSLLPLAVRLSQRKCVVIGGGAVAARRARTLHMAGACVTIIAPDCCEEIDELSQAGAVEVVNVPYSREHLHGAFLVVIATNDPAVNEKIAADGRAAGCLVNDADEPERGDCIIPASVRRGELLLSVTTSGASPSLASRIRDSLEAEFGPEYEAYVALLGEARREVLSRATDVAARRRALTALADDVLILELIRADRPADARARAMACISSLLD